MICKTFIQAVILFSFLANSAAFGLNAKSLIGVDEAGSAQRLEISDQGPANAPSLGGGGGSGDPAYDFAGSTINIDLPTSLDDAGYAYLDDLKASGQLTVEEMKLVQHQFYDQDIQLGTLGQLLLQYVTAGMTSGLTGIQAAMARAAISGGLEGALTGNFDVAAILRDVAFAGVSGAATAGFDLNDTLRLSGDSLLGAVDGQFSLASIANSLGDSVITAGLTTAVYGGDFGAAFLGSFSNSVVNLAQADLQTLIGDRYNGENALVNGGEGSAGHVFEHAIVGCLAGAALGGSCEAGAAAGAISAVYAGAVDPEQALRDQAQFIANATLLGGLGAAVVSGGDQNATMIGAGVAGSAFENNYLAHAQLEQLYDAFTVCETSDNPTACRGQAWGLAQEQSAENYAKLLACGQDQDCIMGHVLAIAEGDETRAKIVATNWNMQGSTGAYTVGGRKAVFNTLTRGLDDMGVEGDSTRYILENFEGTTREDLWLYAMGIVDGCGEFCFDNNSKPTGLFNLPGRGTGVLTPSGGRKDTADDTIDIVGGTQNSERQRWGSWNDYPKVTRNGPYGPQEYAVIGDRLYSQHAVARMQPSGQRYSSGVPTEGTAPPLTGTSPQYVNQPGIQSFDGTQNVRGRSISPNYVEDIIGNSTPAINPANGNRSYSSGDVLVVTSSEGRVITIVTGVD